MDLAPRLAFDDFLRRLRDACRLAFAVEEEAAARRGEDARLFAYTFAAGFLFMSIFLV